MGLDMYLTKQTFVWSNDRPRLRISFVKPTGKTSETKENDYGSINPKNVSTITETIGQWRKANAIHKWFVDNVQDGDDDCGEHYVEIEKLQDLLDIVNEVLSSTKLVVGKVNNGYTIEDGKRKYNVVKGKVLQDPTVAKKLLPTTEGFFFGGTDYDEYYWQDLKDTKKILKEAIADGGDFYYHSSW